MNKLYFVVLIAAALIVGTASSQTAFGQNFQITEGVELSTNQVIFVIGIGSLAGVIRAWQGYDKSPKDFDLLKFVNGIRDNILIAIPIAFGTALTMPDISAVGYVMIFFSVIGVVSMVHKTQEKSIPSNASPEEIKKITDERD